MKRAVLALAALVSVVAPRFLHAQDRTIPATCADCLNQMRRVLVIAAHPDDEDTQLITWLSKGGRASVAYLSLTRGDGGQNLIGNELGEQLGVIRTQELLAARRVDGASQFFTRAYDFGFSKTAAETFAHWPKDSLLADVVKVVRAWRPEVIVAVFSGTPKDGHGQHQVSAILAKEAYETAAADTVRFPVAQFGLAWTPLKFYRWAGVTGFSLAEPTIRINVGEYAPSLGKSYAEIAGESRSQHKSQGFGTLQRKGPVWDALAREDSRVNADTPAKSEISIFDGLPPRHTQPGETGPSDFGFPARDMSIEAIADRREVALGDSARVSVTFYNRSDHVAKITLAPSSNVTLAPGTVSHISVAPDSSFKWTMIFHGNEITQPWWLVTPRNGDLFTPQLPILDPPQIAELLTENQRDKQDQVRAYVGSGGIVPAVTAPIVYRYADPVRGDTQRPLVVSPALSVTLDHAIELARANSQIDRFFNVKLRSAVMSKKPVTVSLTLPAGLTADSASRTIMLDSAGSRTVTFRVRGRLSPGAHALSAVGSMDGKTYSNGYVPIEYEHITPERIYRS